jgi:hypothetical protein
MPEKRLVSRSSSITSSDVFDLAESPLKKHKSARNAVSSLCAAKKLKGRKALNSTCNCEAGHNLESASGSANLIVASLPCSLGSPSHRSPSDESVSDTSSSPTKKVMTKKRKLEEIRHSELTTVEEESATSDWEPVDECYSRQKTKGGSRYRCTLCLKNNEKHTCDREGDMKRHLQSLKHTPKSFTCPNPGCASLFTRSDARKRHLKSCMA